jgi:hypothetical protein
MPTATAASKLVEAQLIFFQSRNQNFLFRVAPGEPEGTENIYQKQQLLQVNQCEASLKCSPSSISLYRNQSQEESL